MPRFASSALILCALVGLASCGGNSKPAATTTRTPTRTSAPAPAAGVPSAITSGPVRGALVGQNHTPIAGRKWNYSVTATDAAGAPVSGTVDIAFAFAGIVVGRDTPPTHPLRDGHWHDNLIFPATAAGHPLAVRAIVHVAQGSITLDWPIVVRR